MSQFLQNESLDVAVQDEVHNSRKEISTSPPDTLRNYRWVLAEHSPSSGKVDLKRIFRLESSVISTKFSETSSKILVKTRYLSNAPGLRVLTQDIPQDRQLAPHHILGKVPRVFSIIEVLKSQRPDFIKGDLFYCTLGWTQLEWIDPDLPDWRLQKLSPNCDLAEVFSINCETLAAYFGLLKVGMATSMDQTVVVSAAAGATGSSVCQIAKRVLGIKTVIGLAGSKEKCRFLEANCGCDVALNYKDLDFVQQLKDATPGYINLFFDNVGGQVLDQVFKRMAVRGRIVSCGSVSSYNTENGGGELVLSRESWQLTTSLRLNIQGFIFFDYAGQFPEALEVIRKWIKDGDLSIVKSIFRCPFERVPNGLDMIFDGKNVGSLVTELID